MLETWGDFAMKGLKEGAKKVFVGFCCELLIEYHKIAFISNFWCAIIIDSAGASFGAGFGAVVLEVSIKKEWINSPKP